MPSRAAGGPTWDVFVCHASEDKADFVDEFAAALRQRGLKVWYDAWEVQLGDDFIDKVNEGLRESRYGVVVLSPSFWEKHWANQEAKALQALEAVYREKRILPVRHRIDEATITQQVPLLGSRVSIGSEQGLPAVVDAVEAAVRDRSGPRPLQTTASPVYNVPDRSVFVGRDEDLSALEAVLADTDATLAASVDGLAGVGKSALARRLCWQLADQGSFPGGIIWLDAKDPNLRSQWAQEGIASRLGIRGGDLDDRANAVVQCVERMGRRVLLVLDNVERWGAPQHGPLPKGTHVRLLLTTRRRNIGTGQFKRHHLDFLPPDASKEFLLELAQRPGLEDDENTASLLEHLGGYALAIELAGTFLREYPDVTPREYLRRLRDAEADPEAKVAGVVGRGVTVHGILRSLWDQLDDDARRAWLIAARFEPVSVGTEISDAVGLDEDARRALRSRALIEEAQSGRWQMHRLVREFGQLHGDGTGRVDARRRYHEGLVAYVRGMDIDAGFRLYLPEQPHLDAAMHTVPDDSSGPKRSDASEYWDCIGKALKSLGRLEDSRNLREQALKSDLRNLGEDHPVVATSRSNLAIVLQDMGNFEGAKTLLEQALNSDLQNFGQDHPAITTRRGNLAMVLRDLGDPHRAKTLLEQALKSNLASFGDDHPAVATSRSNLALVLLDLGDLGGAKRLLEQALDSSLANFGEDHPNVATRRANLATVLADSGDLHDARTLMEQALKADLKNHGEDHPDVALRRSNLAVLLRDLGDLSGAKTLLEQALESDLKNRGEDHPNVARCRSNLAIVLKELGDLGGAKTLLELALNSALKNLEEDHPFVATSRSNLAALLQALGDLNGAKTLQEQVLGSALEKFGEDHPKVAVRRSNLASVLRVLGDLDGAKALLEKALKSDLENLGEDHPSVARCRSNLATVLKELGDLNGAREQAIEARRIAGKQPEGSQLRAGVEKATKWAAGTS